MDLHELWQQHKRWILGVAAGLLLFWIASLVLGSLYESDSIVKKARADANAVSGELYDDAALAALREENQKLLALEQELKKALAWRPRPEYLLEGQSRPADLQFDSMNRTTRQTLRTLCEEKNIDLLNGNLEWAIPTEREDIQGTLLAFDLMDHAVRRLVAAHAQARASDPEALGVVTIEKLKIDRQKAGAAWRGGKSKLRIEDVLQEERVEIAVRADASSIRRFLEACRSQEPPIAVQDLKIMQSRQSGDPLLLTGKLLALVFKPEAQ